VFPLNLYARVRLFHFFARETAGAARTRSSLRPLISGAREFSGKPRAQRAARTRTPVHQRHCEERLRRSNPFFLDAVKWIHEGGTELQHPAGFCGGRVAILMTTPDIGVILKSLLRRGTI
jgi:hypothetical protein